MIGNSAICGCSNLISVELNEGLEDIGNNAFSAYSSLTSITLPSTLKYIRYRAFSGLVSEAYENQRVTLNSKDASKQVSGFEVNGEIKIGNYFYMPAENVKITNITYDNQLLHQELSVWMVMHLQYYWKAIKVKNHKKT